MPNLVRRDNGTYYLWVAVPADIAGEARGTLITIPVGETTTTTKVNTHAKAQELDAKIGDEFGVFMHRYPKAAMIFLAQRMGRHRINEFAEEYAEGIGFGFFQHRIFEQKNSPQIA